MGDISFLDRMKSKQSWRRLRSNFTKCRSPSEKYTNLIRVPTVTKKSCQKNSDRGIPIWGWLLCESTLGSKIQIPKHAKKSIAATSNVERKEGWIRRLIGEEDRRIPLVEIATNLRAAEVEIRGTSCHDLRAGNRTIFSLVALAISGSDPKWRGAGQTTTVEVGFL